MRKYDIKTGWQFDETRYSIASAFVLDDAMELIDLVSDDESIEFIDINGRWLGRFEVYGYEISKCILDVKRQIGFPVKVFKVEKIRKDAPFISVVLMDETKVTALINENVTALNLILYNVQECARECEKIMEAMDKEIAEKD